MKINTSKQIDLACRPSGSPTVENFRLEQASLPTTPPNGLLLRVLYLSLDPYMRGRMNARASYTSAVEIDYKFAWENRSSSRRIQTPGLPHGDSSAKRVRSALQLYFGRQIKYEIRCGTLPPPSGRENETW
jgi:NADPH-dependent curcumin reductase CurA